MTTQAQTKTDLASLQNPAQQIANMPAVSPGFGSMQSFELALRTSKLLSSSTLVPDAYRAQIVDRKQNVIDNPNAIPNCVIALNMAQRMNADPLMVMQNLYPIEGRPSWSSQFIIAAINNCGRFSPLRFEIKRDENEREIQFTTYEWVEQPNGRSKKEPRQNKLTTRDMVCVAWAVEKETGERLESPPVSIELAIREGWFTKPGSKWQTMPEVMLRYRSAAFFGRLYAPELLMGLPTEHETADVIDLPLREIEPSASIQTPAAKAAEASAPAPAPAPAQEEQKPEEEEKPETSDSGPVDPPPPPPPPAPAQPRAKIKPAAAPQMTLE